MGDLRLPPLPPLPPPVGSAVLPSVSSGNPPPPTGPPPESIPGNDPEPVPDPYEPPGWLTKERGIDRTNTLSPKIVLLSVAGLMALLLVMGLIMTFLALRTSDDRLLELDQIDRPTFPDQEVFVESMADPSMPANVSTDLSVR